MFGMSRILYYFILNSHLVLVFVYLILQRRVG